MDIKFEEKYGLFVDGDFVKPESNEWIDTFNPATGEKLAQIADAGQEDVDKAVNAARAAFEGGWKDTSIEERSAILLQIAQIIEDNQEFLATVETMNNGKPIRETSALDIPLAVDHFRYFAGVIRSEEGSSNILQGRYLSLILREPIGVVGQIIPWNFPFLMAAWKIAPALATGNTIVIKPASATSLSILELARLIKDVLPKGVFNVVTGRGSHSGEIIQHHKGLDKLAFTGSTEVGQRIGVSAAENLIPSTLELGGKSANIIFDDADMDKALDGAILGILFNQGQVCCAGSRLFIQEGIYDEFLKRLQEKFEAVKVGDPLDPETQMGSQIDQRQMKKILKYVDTAKENGGKIITGGCQILDGDLANGAFVMPTLIADQDNKAVVSQEEIFGPVLVVQKFKDVDEVIDLANDSIYGLGGAVFTKDINKAFKVANSVRTGRMWVNTYNQLPAGAPFGGYKKSGIGRETHKMMIDAYSETKNIFIDLKDDVSGFYN